MTVLLYPRDSRQDEGFYRFLFEALRRHAGARMTAAPRPVPRMEKPRQHESVWIDWDGIQVLVDMSDHVFLFDLPALKSCDIYLKANLNISLAEKILAQAGVTEESRKIRPFFFLPPTLTSCARLARWSCPFRSGDWRPFDYCHIVGVYDNPFLTGAPPEADLDIPAGVRTNHFWSRYHVQRALKGTGMKGFSRLTSRGNPALLDKGGVVRANLDSRIFLLVMTASRATILNTLPHAVFPWKVWESVALGVPFVVERRPLMTMPKALELAPGRHYLELLPELPGFDESLDPDDPRAYRLFPEIRLERLQERAEWLKDEIRNRSRMAEMRAEVDSYRRRVLRPEFMAEFFGETVRHTAAGQGGAIWGG